jgi:hypothetical protein
MNTTRNRFQTQGGGVPTHTGKRTSHQCSFLISTVALVLLPKEGCVAFIRLDINFFSHPKTLRMKARIGDAAFWVMPSLWCYMANNQPDGDMSGFTAAEIAAFIDYGGDPTTLLRAMIECGGPGKSGFVDENPLRLHDWQEHNGWHMAQRERAKNAAEARWRPKNALAMPQAMQKPCTSNAPGNATERRGDKITEDTTTPPAPTVPVVAPVKIMPDFEKRVWLNISEKDRAGWVKAYPAVDVDIELAKAMAWLVANPTKKKSQYGRFLNGWFSRCQDRGGTVKGASESGQASPPGKYAGIGEKWNP